MKVGITALLDKRKRQIGIICSEEKEIDMGLKYEIPHIGEIFSEKDLEQIAEKNGYELRAFGSNVEGEKLITLSEPNTPVGMSFLFVEKDSTEPFKRVY